MYSIARRIRQVFFVISLCMIVFMVLLVAHVNEDLEQTLLQTDFRDDLEFFLGQVNPQEVLSSQTANLVAIYIPAQRQDQIVLPELLADVEVPFFGELTKDDRYYLVKTGMTDAGVYYLSKDITPFEDREQIFDAILAVASLCLIMISFLLSLVASRWLVRPLQQLTWRIRQTAPAASMQRLPIDTKDLELGDITQTFNGLLDQLESFVRREKSLVNLASHELRTPIAVVQGALDILEQRDQLTDQDRKTILRIRRATREMEQNVSSLLALARRSEKITLRETVSLAELAKSVVEDLGSQFNVGERVVLLTSNPGRVEADPVLARMLLRNLLQNALQHTRDKVMVEIRQNEFDIVDYGRGLPSAQEAVLTGQVATHREVSELTGLGLYITTLICERFGWHLEVDRSDTSGTVIRVRFATAR